MEIVSNLVNVQNVSDKIMLEKLNFKVSLNFVAVCGSNEHYTDCGSSCGDLTCNLQTFAAMLCPAVCVSGCFCNEGIYLFY